MSSQAAPASEREARLRGVAIAVAALALFGAILVWYATTAGAGIIYDSVDYARMAAELRSGQGLSNIHFPPGLPGIWAMAADPYALARVLNITALAALVALIGAAVWWSTRKPLPTLFASAIIAVSTPLLGVYTMALSEPLALVLGSAGLWLTLVALADNSKWIWWAAALSLGLAVIVRYAAVIYPATAVLFVLFERRWRRAAWLASWSAVPITTWAVRNLIITHAPTDRSFAYHPIPRSGVQLGREVVSAWLDPVGLVFPPGSPRRGWLAVAAAAALFAWGIWRGNRLARLASLFAVGYVTFLLFVMAFLDAGSILDSRLLIPAFVAGVWVGAELLSWILDNRAILGPLTRWLAGAALGCAIFFVAAHAYFGVRYAAQIHREGIGVTSARWRHSPLVAAVDALPPGAAVWTNDRLTLSVLTHAEVHELPGPLQYTTLRPWAGYAAALAVIPSGGYIADFMWPPSVYRGAVEDLARTKGLDTLTSTRDGALYRVR